jgi:hypothetical protein
LRRGTTDLGIYIMVVAGLARGEKIDAFFGFDFNSLKLRALSL